MTFLYRTMQLIGPLPTFVSYEIREQKSASMITEVIGTVQFRSQTFGPTLSFRLRGKVEPSTSVLDAILVSCISVCRIITMKNFELPGVYHQCLDLLSTPSKNISND